MTSRRQIFNCLSTPIKRLLIVVFSVALVVLTAISSFKYFGYLSLFLDLSILINLFVILSWKYQLSLPVFSNALRLKYSSLKRYLEEFNSKKDHKYYLKLISFKIIYYLAILFYDLESATNIIKDGEDPLNIAINPKDSKQKAVKTAYLQEYFKLLEQKKKQATLITISLSTATVTLALILITLFSNSTLAATFGWVQSDWSGGASATMATHTNRTGWNQYASKDSGVDASSTVALGLYSSTTVDTLSADFLLGTTTNAFVSTTANMIIMLKPQNSNCATSTECANNSCFAGTCIACGTDLVQYDGGPYDSNGITTTTGGYYRTTKIASSTGYLSDQCWFKDNLNAGTMIGSKLADNATLQDQTDNSVIEKYCYNYVQQGNAGQITSGTADCKNYGAFYQWPEAVQYSNGVTTSTGTTVASGNIRGVCPVGWHIPSDTEWTALTTYIGGTTNAGIYLKATSTWNFYAVTTTGDNSSGFRALAAGSRNTDGSFGNRGANAYVWASLPDSITTVAWNRGLYYSSAGVNRGSNGGRTNGFSVRCLKDATSTAQTFNSTSYFTSAVKDFGAKVNLGTFSWNASTTDGVTAVTMEVRTGVSASTTDGTWSAWTVITSGSTPDASLSGKQYFQYRATMTSNELNTVATLNDVSISWSTYDRGHVIFTRVSPTMTANTTVINGITYVASAFSELQVSNYVWKIFNASYGQNEGWLSLNLTYPIWVKIDLASSTQIYSYKLAWGFYSSPKSWTLQGSNNNSDWTIVDTKTSVSDWYPGEIRQYNLSSIESYRYYKVDITAFYSHNIYFGISEFSLGYTPTTLTSSIYDSGSSANIIPKVAWTAINTSTANTVKLQIRSSNSTSTLASSTWCGYDDTSVGCTGNNYFEYNEINKQITDLTHPLLSGGDDQYFQYRLVLASGGTSTPIVSNVNVTYVVNAAPEFTTTTTVVQRTSDGKVLINYSALDSDTASSGVGCPDCVVASLRYTINNGSSWTTINPSYLSTPQGSNLGFGTSTIAQTTTTYQLLWDAKNDGLNGIYSTTTRIEITLNDKEGGNNTAVTTTANFTLDVKNPTAGAHPILVYAHGAAVNGTPATLALSATDSSANLTMCITLDSTYASCTNNYVPYNASSSVVLSTDPRRVYVSFKDAYNNTSTASVLTPDTPNNIIIKDVSDTTIGSYQEFIVWKAVASTTFKYYHVEHSTDGTNFTELDLVNDSSINFYFHQNLTQSTTHYYRVYTEDLDGNTSFYTTTVNDSVDGVGGTNPNPPVLSNIEIVATTTQSATIEWDTNEPANSTVHYSMDPDISFGTVAGSSVMTQNAGTLGRHRVTLTNLTPSQTYHFTVESQNLLSVSGTNINEGVGWSFSTLSGPVISSVTESSITNNGATIVWNTDIASNSTVYYTTSNTFSSFENVGVSAEVTGHSVTLTNLTKGTTYYYYVKSGVATDNNSNNYYSFTTPSDNVAPVITNASSTIVIDTQALINWTTNEMSDSEVVYGTTPGSYTLSSVDTNLNTNHNVALSSLATSTTYYFKVISTDASGNEASSTNEMSFTTLETLSQESAVALRELAANAAGQVTGAATVTCGGGGGGASIDRSKPVITSVVVSGVTGDSATFSWVTDRKANSMIGCSTVKNYDTSLVTQHSINLNYLNQSTSYICAISSIDENGNIGTADATFSTTDALGISPDNSTSLTNKDSAFTLTMDKVSAYLSAMSAQVSLGVFETSLNNQYNTLRSLSNTVPPPILSGEPRVLTTANTATVTWKTDKEANSLVALVPEANYDKTKGENAYAQVVGNSTESTLTHIVVISDLEPETIYHYQVRSRNNLGALGQSADFTFLTKSKELEISNYTIEKISGSTAIFKWLTNNETDAQVKFTPFRNGTLDVQAVKTVKNKNFTTLHEVTVDAFESGIQYEIELSGKDIKSQIITKKISTFSTGEDNFPPTIYQVQTESALSAGKESNVQTIISWLTDEPATSQVFYQKGVGAVAEEAWEKTQTDPNYSKKHIVVLTKFEPGQIYQFKIQSADSNGNLGISKVYTILAPKQKESVFQVIMKNFEEVFGWTQKINQ